MLRNPSPHPHSSAARHPDLFDLAEEGSDNPGRDQAHDNTDAWWRSCAEAALQAIAATDRVFQAFDLVSEPYCVPEPDHANRWGPLFSRAARAGWIEAAGVAPSRRPTTSGSLCRTWRGRRD